MVTDGRQGQGRYGEVTLVEYRLLAPDIWTPPPSHKRLAEGRYVGPYETDLDLLDTLGTIDVIEWEVGHG